MIWLWVVNIKCLPSVGFDFAIRGVGIVNVDLD